MAAGDDSILNGSWLYKYRLGDASSNNEPVVDQGEDSNSTINAKHGSNSSHKSLTPLSQGS